MLSSSKIQPILTSSPNITSPLTAKSPRYQPAAKSPRKSTITFPLSRRKIQRRDLEFNAKPRSTAAQYTPPRRRALARQKQTFYGPAGRGLFLAGRLCAQARNRRNMSGYIIRRRRRHPLFAAHMTRFHLRGAPVLRPRGMTLSLRQETPPAFTAYA